MSSRAVSDRLLLKKKDRIGNDGGSMIGALMPNAMGGTLSYAQSLVGSPNPPFTPYGITFRAWRDASALTDLSNRKLRLARRIMRG